MGAGEVGVLWVNVGSPAAPTTRAVRRYLRQFLADPAVVDAPRLVWLPVLHGIVLPFRAPRSAELYRRIWTSEGAPLLVNSRRFAGALARELGPGFRVALGMRYGEPSIEHGLRELADCARVRTAAIDVDVGSDRTAFKTKHRLVRQDQRHGVMIRWPSARGSRLLAEAAHDHVDADRKGRAGA